MKKRLFLILIILILVLIVFASFIIKKDKTETKEGKIMDINEFDSNDFQIDLTLDNDGKEIHYSAYIPKNVENINNLSMYITLPGWEGLYFQGVGANLKYEDFAYVAKKMNHNMIILAPQLNDWGITSAKDTIYLTKYYKEKYNVKKIYINGYSGGGETLSLVLQERPDLYDRALLVSSQWDGHTNKLIQSKTPVYLFTGENDSYYGSSSFKDIYDKIYNEYKKIGLIEKEINELIILDIRNHEYFVEHNVSDEHAGGGLAAHEESIMKWLLELE